MKPKNGPWGRRVNAWLEEVPGEIFKDGKWRFWFLAVISIQLLNAGLTALIFESAGALHNYMGAVLLGLGALVAWIGVGCLHYSDSSDTSLARGVSALDSATLLFAAIHLSFLLWIYGHHYTLKSADAEYKIAATAYNDKASQIQADNARIAEAIRDAAESDKQRAKIENDTAYQQRRAAEAGMQIARQRGRSESATASLSTSPIELEKPKAPEESATAYITRWDALIRLANLAELLLACITLIYIRNRSAKTNPGAGGGVVAGSTFTGPGRPARYFARGAEGENTDPKA